MEIKDKVAIVTGGIRGIGFTSTKVLLRNGAKYVAMFDLYKPDQKTVTTNLRKLEREFENERFGYYFCDVTCSQKFEEHYKMIMDEHSYVDILVNNAGTAKETAIDTIINVNLKAVIKCSFTALEFMSTTKGGSGGAIIVTASISGLLQHPVSPILSATEHGVISFVHAMKEHTEKLGIRIMAICPGTTNTNMMKVENVRNYPLEFIDEEKVANYLETVNEDAQEPENVAYAIISLIEKGEAGAVWVSQNNEPPFAVRDIESLAEIRI